MINPFRKWLAPKWKPIGEPVLHPTSAGAWEAMICISKGGEERMERHRFRHKPTEAEVKERAKAICKTRNAGGDKDAFRLVDKETGKVLAEVHGIWTDPTTCVVTDLKLVPA